tara:strand:- start:442 stop:651 length:210 start_codon:yes stop_codon:yes gene_type:complete
VEKREIKMLSELSRYVAEQYNNLEQWEQNPGTAQMRTADCAMMLKSIGKSIDDIFREAGLLTDSTTGSD